MKIKEALLFAIKKFEKINIPTASLDAEVLLSFILQEPKEYIYTYPENNLTKKQLRKFRKIVSKRSDQKPIAYLINHKEFYGFDFYVDKNVLIPRPETEIIVEEVKKIIEESNITSLADIGTGSGCIPITLKKLSPQIKIYATDISKKALKVARKNATENKVEIEFLHGDLLKTLTDKNINIITANLPYVQADILKQNKFLKAEPKKALDGGASNGLELYKKMFKQIKQGLVNPQFIICELAIEQKGDFERLVKKYLPSFKYSTIDLESKTRFTSTGVTFFILSK